jgi:hypothetical protein
VDRWRQIYHFSKSSSSFRSFLAHLEGAKIASGVWNKGAFTQADPLQPAQRLETGSEGRVQSTPACTTDKVESVDVSVSLNDPTSAASNGTQPAVSNQPGRLNHPVITRELAWKHARENVIMVTWSNFKFMDFVENWAAHLSTHRTPSHQNTARQDEQDKEPL